jgi:endonuclease/exonuclease/phosphatase family metal-dependent hydrolase
MELRVMTFNIWYGGEQVSFAQTAEVIRAADPDLIAIQEPDGNLRRLAQAAGYSYIDEKRNIISRYPLFDPDSEERRFPYTRVMVRPGQIVGFANTHLSSTPFGPDMLRDGSTTEEVLKVEKELRLKEVTPYIESLRELIARNIPVFFAGDFNTPSHQDWVIRKPPLEWPVTKALADAGFRDSYREVHPHPAMTPGLTYTPGYPHPYRKATETLERIDMIWVAGKMTTMDSKIIGEAENPSVDIIVAPYPSDHRAVVSTFRLLPAPADAMIAVDTLSFQEGSDFTVRFHIPDFADWRVFIVPRGGNPEKDTALSAKGPNLMSTRPTFKFGSLGLSAGTYDAVLADAKIQELARTTFYVMAKDAVPELHLEKSDYKSGEAIEVSWRNAPGMKNDWIGIYRAGDPDLYTGYITFIYTGARVEGSASLSQNLEAGDYELRLMREDSYVMLAKTTFSVR